MLNRYKKLFVIFSAVAVSIVLFLVLKQDSKGELHEDSNNTAPVLRNCGTMEHMKMLLESDVQYRQNLEAIDNYVDEYVKTHKNGNDNVVITIPTVVHVVWNQSVPQQNISYQQVVSQINILNEDYRRKNRDTVNTPAPFKPIGADIQVEFCLARRDPNNIPTLGVTRTSTTVPEFGLNNYVKFTSAGGEDAWDRNKYLNLWVCNLGGTLLGYAEFPGGNAATDGVVIHYRYFGNIGTATAPYHLGRTATHEVGHWLYLYHIWGDDNGSCAGSDLVGDTPNQASEFYGCPGYPTLDACTSTVPGVMFMNYMDYTDDGCMNIFTQGQSLRMNAVMTGFRLPIQTSPGCTPVSGQPIAMFTSDSVSIEYGNTVHFSDISAGIPTTWNWSFPGGTPSSSNAQNPNIVYNTPGLYTVTLRVSNTSGSDSLSVTNYLRVRGAGMSSFNLVSPPTLTRILVAANDPTLANFIWQRSSTNPVVYYKFKIRKIPSGTEYSYLSNNSGADSVIGIRKGFLDSLAAAMGTTGDSVRCTWRVYSFNGVDSLLSASSYLVTLVRNVIGINKISTEVPGNFALYNNYPNPFNPATKIRFDIPAGNSAFGDINGHIVTLKIYDILGKEVSELVNEKLEAGKYEVDWNASDFPSGIYFYRLEAGSFSDSRKMILVK